MARNDTVLQKTYAKFISEANPVYNDLIKELNNSVTSPKNLSRQVDNAFDTVGYEEQISDLMGNTVTASAMGATVGTPISLNPAKAKYHFLFEDYTGTGSLSSRLHDGSAQREVTKTIKGFFSKKTSAEQLFRELKDTKAVSLDKLPKQLLDLSRAYRKADMLDPDTVKALKQARAQAERYVKGLQGANSTSKELKKAYANILKATDKGSEEALNKAISLAVKKKVAYLNKRIATTESARAYDMSFNRALYEDEGITGYRVVLSSGHPVADICNVYAEADLYGMGIGVMPKGEGAMIPFHPNCRCGKVPVRGLKGAKKGKYDPKRAEDYVKAQPDKKQGQIINKISPT